MKKKYSKIISNSNILFGVHCLLKGILILLLFIILYSVIWIKEKYINYLKISIYFQIFIFLFILTVILVTNNPSFFDICLKCTFYVFLLLSILQIIVIILEIVGIVQNFQDFKNFFHECSYYRSYNDIMDSKYHRTCLFINEDLDSDGQYKYLCFYNSEEEYHNKFCDGLICRQNNKFYEKENDYTKCSGININLITFPENNIFYKKERQLFNKMKNKKVYICSRKKRLDNILSNSNTDTNSKFSINNLECPDINPSKKYIVFIYIEIIFHIIVDLLFIYELFVVNNLNKLYYNITHNNNLHINTIESQSSSNSSNNRVNTPSVNEVMVNIDKRKNLENEEDIKIDSYGNDNNNNYKIDINNNRQINIMNVNQNLKICKNNNNGGSLLINALKNPKSKNGLKNRMLKEQEKRNENEYIDIVRKNHHPHLKSSQLKNLINISTDNLDNNNSLSKDNNITMKINKNRINKKINIINEDEKSNKKINSIKKNDNLDTNFNTPYNENMKSENTNNVKIINDKYYYKSKSKEIKDNINDFEYEENKEEQIIYQNNDNIKIHKIVLDNITDEDFKNNEKEINDIKNTESNNLNNNDYI